MKRSGVYNSVFGLELVWVILVLIFGLLVFKKAYFDKSDYGDLSVQIGISLIKTNATISTGIQYYHFQKIWMPNKGNFRILTFNQIKFLDNNKVVPRILILNNIRKKSTGFLIPVIHYSSFPEESDEIPILS